MVHIKRLFYFNRQTSVFVGCVKPDQTEFTLKAILSCEDIEKCRSFCVRVIQNA